MSIYINPYTDFGFKKLFGEEGNKNLLMDFLNQILPEKHQISDLEFQNVAVLPDGLDERKAFFDIHCQAKSGERFIVEMQKARVDFFKDRSLYYLSYPIRDQAQRGPWNFALSPIYFIAIMDFEYDKAEQTKFRRDICLKDQDSELFYDKLQLTFLQMPAFKKQEWELETRFDKWAYFLKNLESFDAIPQILNEPVFAQAFETAKVANFSREQRWNYERSWLSYCEARAVEETAKREGLKEGLKEGLEEGLKKGLKEGLKEGLKKGMEKGMQKGMEKGMEEGRGKRENELIVAMHESGMSVNQIAQVVKKTEAEVAQVIGQYR